MIEDGQAVLFDGRTLDPDGAVPVGRIHLDGVPIGREALRDRRLLAMNGIAVVVVGWPPGRRRPGVALKGLCDPDELDALEQAASRYVAGALEDLPPLRREDPDDVRETARLAVRRFMRRELGRIPLAVAFVVGAGT